MSNYPPGMTDEDFERAGIYEPEQTELGEGDCTDDTPDPFEDLED